ncbi:GntR family transcriptional regulator [Desulfovermiculus halophilus]|jgi:DNA-binding GntR family transcriptional regulator|uniref:GntR family transcriptional regulator n=1 Tax=Desulfovermiculus halophilus TaxID=339722 RepID=UPI000684681D|nr:GntR family transcriptional regulator [Desulfovermiculus halophilus]
MQLDIGDIQFENAALGEKITDILTEAILEGKFKGGQQLIEQDLQKIFGVSRSPLREAFRVLEKRGLVHIIPRKGTFVKTITLKDIEDNFPVRARLEGLAAREAHARMNGKTMDDLQFELENMKFAAEHIEPKSFWRHHSVFHNVFIEASENQVLIDILYNLRMHSLWYQFSYQYYQEDLERAYRIHENIFQKLTDPHSARQEIEDIVRDHIEVAFSKFLRYLDAQGE